MRPTLIAAALLAAATFAHAQSAIEVTLPAGQHTGHLILVIAKNPDIEPRNQLSETYDSAQGFGVDVTASSTPIRVDAQTFGYPIRSLASIAAGDYQIQAVFNVYETFHMADGRTLFLPPDQGEGQHWNRKPGNPYSAPLAIHFDPALHSTLKITLDKVVPPIPDPDQLAAQNPAAKWLKHLKFRSEKLSRFYGRDTYLGAWVLLPDGFDEHPTAHYPLIVYQDHFSATMRPAFSAVPIPANGPTRSNGYKLFQDWTSGRLPRVILLYVQNANPFYDDSYDVDSANVGPYGSAINDELIPAIEKQYRGIGQGWARATYGGSTGGWESLATQIFYPDSYNGTWTACPDPVDFHGYQGIDLYKDDNAFTRRGPFGEIPVPADRKPDGSITANTGPEMAFEYVTGTHGRSAEQWNIWQAVFSPIGPDGYPAPVLDPLTGTIDKKVVAYWHDHYDLNAILQRDWPTLGPKLEGKIHIAVGDGDTFFLNNAVHLLQTSLEATRNPHSDATFQYGPGMPHCYTGGPSELTMQENNANWTQRVLPLMTDHMLKTAPAGADTKSWRY